MNIQGRFASRALALMLFAAATSASAQDSSLAPPATAGVAQPMPDGALLQPGEAYVTRFSGTASGTGADGKPVTVINIEGVVGSIIDIRSPGRAPQGAHWFNKPERHPVTAGEVGQVFGVVLDDSASPNIYLSATAAFGLHLAPGTQDWMPGMWGEGGGPGTIYRLSASDNYRPSVFANITLDGRENTGAALGNMAFDRWHHQLFVSDLETGMIHRLNADDGTDLGHYDHGVTGRSSFFDVDHNQQANLPPIAFDSDSIAHVADCPMGPFERSPQCWNLAASGRRVWGIGVRHDYGTGETRLFYAVWSSPDFGDTDAWRAASDDDQRNAVWSIKLGADGDFDTSDIRREFMLPDFFVQPDDIERAGFSQPVSDISFSACSDRPVMLVAERGGMRNLGLSVDNPFAYPHEARALRFELDTSGVWQPEGRYDVGNDDRKSIGQPFLRADCAGGIAFAPGYTADFRTDSRKPDQYVWMTGDYLCSPEAPCHGYGTPPVSATAGSPQPVASRTAGGDDSQVHGIQGLDENLVAELMPASALAPYPPAGAPYPPNGPDNAYLIDTDIYIDSAGRLIESERVRNDATKIGSIAIYELCEPHRQVAALPPAPPPLPDADTPVVQTPGSPAYPPPPWWHHRRHHPPTHAGCAPGKRTCMPPGHRGSCKPGSPGCTTMSHGGCKPGTRGCTTNTQGSGTTTKVKQPTSSGSGITLKPQLPKTTQFPKTVFPQTLPKTTTATTQFPQTLPNTTQPTEKIDPGKMTTAHGGMSGCVTNGGVKTCYNNGTVVSTTKEPSTTAKDTAIKLRPSTSTARTATNTPANTHVATKTPTNTPISTGIKLKPSTSGQHPSTNTTPSGATPQPKASTPNTTTHTANTTPATAITTPQTTTHTTTPTTTTRTTSLTPSNQHVNTSHTTTHRFGAPVRTTRSHSSRTTRSTRSTHTTYRSAHPQRRVVARNAPRAHVGGGGFRPAGGNRRRSDIRLKRDIVAVGRLDNGIGLYRFRYKGNDRTLYVGVMAQEVRNIVPAAVTRGRDGYLRVDYDRLGLQFMTWDEWMARGAKKSQMAQ